MEEGTKRLYLESPYKVEFEAQVVEKVIGEQKPALILDQTCFYPESGGQPCDKGMINGIEVIKVLEDGARIIHLLAEDISSDKVTGNIKRVICIISRMGFKNRIIISKLIKFFGAQNKG